MKIRSFAAALVVLSLPGLVAAEQEGGAAPSGAVGPETRAWIELQTSGTAASPTARPMPGDVAERVYKRHADSFAHPIPEELSRESFIGGNGGGGGSSGGK